MSKKFRHTARKGAVIINNNYACHSLRRAVRPQSTQRRAYKKCAQRRYGWSNAPKFNWEARA
jgi:hypothetical protein